MTLSVVDGFITPRTIDDIDCTAVTRIYHKGELISEPVDTNTLEDDTYLLSAVAVNGSKVQFSAYKVTKESGEIRLYQVNLQDLYLTDELRNAMCEVSTIFHGLL